MAPLLGSGKIKQRGKKKEIGQSDTTKKKLLGS